MRIQTKNLLQEGYREYSRYWFKEALPGGDPRSLVRILKMSNVDVFSRLHNAVRNLATYICLCQSFVAISFECCHYFLAHVACRNLPWQGLFKHSRFFYRSQVMSHRSKETCLFKHCFGSL